MASLPTPFWTSGLCDALLHRSTSWDNQYVVMREGRKVCSDNFFHDTCKGLCVLSDGVFWWPSEVLLHPSAWWPPNRELCGGAVMCSLNIAVAWLGTSAFPSVQLDFQNPPLCLHHTGWKWGRAEGSQLGDWTELGHVEGASQARIPAAVFVSHILCGCTPRCSSCPLLPPCLIPHCASRKIIFSMINRTNCHAALLPYICTHTYYDLFRILQKVLSKHRSDHLRASTLYVLLHFSGSAMDPQAFAVIMYLCTLNIS